MKKQILTVWVVLAVTFAFFGSEKILRADDALVLPQGVYRFTAGSSFITSKQEYTATGEKADIGASLGGAVKGYGSLLNLATSNTFPGASWTGLNPTSKVESSVTREDIALEYGLTELLSISFRLPAYLSVQNKVVQNADMVTAVNALNTAGAPSAGSGKLGELFRKLSQDGTKAGTFGDLLLGAKYQFAHSASSPIASEAGTYRAAAAFGVKLPTGSIASPDSNDLSTTTANDTKTWIVGARTYFDYQFTSFFYANFYTEHEYRLGGDRKHLYTSAAGAYEVLDMKYRPGFYNHLELDLVATPQIIENLLSESGVRLSGDFTGVGKYTTAAAGHEDLLNERAPAYKSYTVSPYIGVFYTGAPFPMKFKVVSYLASGGEGDDAKVLGGYSGILYAYLKF